MSEEREVEKLEWEDHELDIETYGDQLEALKRALKSLIDESCSPSVLKLLESINSAGRGGLMHEPDWNDAKYREVLGVLAGYEKLIGLIQVLGGGWLRTLNVEPWRSNI